MPEMKGLEKPWDVAPTPKFSFELDPPTDPYGMQGWQSRGPLSTTGGLATPATSTSGGGIKPQPPVEIGPSNPGDLTAGPPNRNLSVTNGSAPMTGGAAAPGGVGLQAQQAQAVPPPAAYHLPPGQETSQLSMYRGFVALLGRAMNDMGLANQLKGIWEGVGLRVPTAAEVQQFIAMPREQITPGMAQAAAPYFRSAQSLMSSLGLLPAGPTGGGGDPVGPNDPGGGGPIDPHTPTDPGPEPEPEPVGPPGIQGLGPMMDRLLAMQYFNDRFGPNAWQAMMGGTSASGRHRLATAKKIAIPNSYAIPDPNSFGVEY